MKLTARQQRALNAAAKEAALAKEEAQALKERHQRMNAAVRTAHRTGVGYDVISHHVKLTKGRVAQIIRGSA